MYLAMGKSKAAIRDLSKVVELKQDFTSVSIAGTEDCSSVKNPELLQRRFGVFFRLCSTGIENTLSLRGL